MPIRAHAATGTFLIVLSCALTSCRGDGDGMPMAPSRTTSSELLLPFNSCKPPRDGTCVEGRLSDHATGAGVPDALVQLISLPLISYVPARAVKGPNAAASWASVAFAVGNSGRGLSLFTSVTLK